MIKKAVNVTKYFLRLDINTNLDTKVLISREKHTKKDDYFVAVASKDICVNDYLSLYKSIGEDYNWYERLIIPAEEVSELINSDNTYVYYFMHNEVIIGFSELVVYPKYVEILYFGLKPEYHGKGLGSYFFNKVVNLALKFNKDWVQLNTCSLDDPNALKVYNKFGFEEYRSETFQLDVNQN